MKNTTFKKLGLLLAGALVPVMFAQSCTVTLPGGFDYGYGPYDYYDYYTYDEYYFDVGYDDYYYDDYYYDDFFDWWGW